jgi:hypothetical protein
MSTLAPLHKHRELHYDATIQLPVENAQAPSHTSVPTAFRDAPLTSTSRAPVPVDVDGAGDKATQGNSQPGRESDDGVEGRGDARSADQDQAASAVQTMSAAMPLQSNQMQHESHGGRETVGDVAQVQSGVEARDEAVRQDSSIFEHDESSLFDHPSILAHHDHSLHHRDDPRVSSGPLVLFEPRHQARASSSRQLGDDETSYAHEPAHFDSASLERDSGDQVRSAAHSQQGAVSVRSSKHSAPPSYAAPPPSLPSLRASAAHEWVQTFGVTNHQYSRTQSLNQVRGTLSDFKSQLAGSLPARHATSQGPSRISTSSLSRAQTSLGWVEHGSRASSKGGWSSDYHYTYTDSNVNLDKIGQNNSNVRHDGGCGTGPRTPPMSPRFSRGKSGSSALLPRLPTGLSVLRSPASEWARVSS